MSSSEASSHERFGWLKLAGWAVGTFVFLTVVMISLAPAQMIADAKAGFGIISLRSNDPGSSPAAAAPVTSLTTAPAATSASPSETVAVPSTAAQTATVTVTSTPTPTATGLTTELGGVALIDGLAARGGTVVLDPGHNGGNAAAKAQIAKPVDVGNGTKVCNTTGTSNATQTEHALNFEVASKVKRVLEERGITVVMTRNDDAGVGPCIDERAAIANRAKADLSVSIHADGSESASVRGFHVIAPGADPKLDGIVANRDQVVVANSLAAAEILRDEFLKDSSLPAIASPSGTKVGPGLSTRTDLGGLNLLQGPGVMIEMGEMTNPTDASILGSSEGTDKAAAAIANAIMGFVASGRSG